MYNEAFILNGRKIWNKDFTAYHLTTNKSLYGFYSRENL